MKSKRVKTKKRPKPSRKPAERRPLVFIVGDVENVLEYASLCTSHGLAVACNWNDYSAPSPPVLTATVRREKNVPRDASFALELTNVDLEKKRQNLVSLDKALPPTTIVLSSSLTITATEQASWLKHKTRLIGCGVLPTFSETPIIEIAPTVFSPSSAVEIVQEFLRTLGKEIELVQDRIGMVFPRILCRIVNEGAFALQEDVSSPQSLDVAMKIGADFPFGPIEWADRIGIDHVVAVLSALHRETGEERTRVAPLLAQMAASGSWWRRKQGNN